MHIAIALAQMLIEPHSKKLWWWQLLYGVRLRLCALCLRVKDVDFAHRQILKRDGKGYKSHVMMLLAVVTDEPYNRL